MIVLDAIKKLLDANKVSYQCWTHPDCSTSEEGAAIRGTPLMSGAKALIFRSEGKFLMLVIPGDKEASMTSLKMATRTKSLSLATHEEALQVTGCTIGSIPPFGNLFKIPVYVDKTLWRNETIYFNAGRHDTSIGMSIDDWDQLVQPIRVAVAR
ncbi:MAG TPA: YbaK/EbsC family protein [Candidatus Binatia bacterium]|nr:YbaK/EbsC family protein [Candidatus Binatia bacterium]